MSISHTRKAQISLEFVIMISLALIVFAGFYAALTHKQLAAIRNNIDLEAEMIADQVAYEIDLVLTQGENFTKEISLPLKIEGMIYNIPYEVTENYTLIFLNYDDRFSLSYTSANISGTISAGNNTLRNIRGVIYAN